MESYLHIFIASPHTNKYLSLLSCHPKHCTTSIPYSQAIPIKRICSSSDIAKMRQQELRSHLKNRCYKRRDVDKGFLVLTTPAEMNFHNTKTTRST